jgi:proteasome lid subunit RPN8/RPN11
MTRELRFRLKDAKWDAIFTAEVQSVLKSNMQMDRRSTESVGQLFSKNLTATTLNIGLATTLPVLRSSYSGVRFNPEVAYQERVLLFEEGWHCVGIWHSHPEPLPQPSTTDHELAADYAQAARPQLAGFLFVIVGNGRFPKTISVSVHDGSVLYAMECIRA